MKYDFKSYDALEIVLNVVEHSKKESKCKTIIGCYLGETDDSISITFGYKGGRHIISKSNILYITKLSG